MGSEIQSFRDSLVEIIDFLTTATSDLAVGIGEYQDEVIDRGEVEDGKFKAGFRNLQSISGHILAAADAA